MGIGFAGLIKSDVRYILLVGKLDLPRHNLIEGVTLPLTLPFKSIDKMTVLIDYSPKLINFSPNSNLDYSIML